MIGVLFPNEFLVSVNNSCPIWKPKKLLGTTGLIREKERKVGSFLCIFFVTDLCPLWCNVLTRNSGAICKCCATSNPNRFPGQETYCD